MCYQITLKYCAVAIFYEKMVLDYVDEEINRDKKEPTDLNAEAEKLCIGFINDELLSESEYLEEEETKKFGEYTGLKLKMAYYACLKRHDPKMFRKLQSIYTYSAC